MEGEEYPSYKANRRLHVWAVGKLANPLRFLLEQASACQDDGELTTAIEDLNRIHEWFRRTLDTNKYIHKSREVVGFTRGLLAHFVDDVLRGRKSEAVREGLLDVRFEVHAELDRCLYGQATSRFIELCRQLECLAVTLPRTTRDRFVPLATEIVAAGEHFEEALRPHWAAWTAGRGSEAR